WNTVCLLRPRGSLTLTVVFPTSHNKQGSSIALDGQPELPEETRRVLLEELLAVSFYPALLNSFQTIHCRSLLDLLLLTSDTKIRS
ncbi:hypothetical protein GOODEAATRI_024619, partial [Goodea atripinnis]